MPVSVRPVRPDELLEWFNQLEATFFIWPSDAEAAARTPWAQEHLERRLAAFEDGRIVGTYRSFPSRMTLPGGASIPVSAVSAVSTRPTHRRRGILTQLIDADIAQGIERGDVASILYAAEWPIYGRFGYGPATWQARWTLRTRAARFPNPPSGSMEILRAADARSIVPAVYERYLAGQAGEISRLDYWWDIDLGLIEAPGQPRWKGSIAIHRDAAGEPDGYVRYKGEEHWDEGIPDNVVSVSDLIGVTPEVEVELWRFVAALDLVATAKANGRRVSEPMTWWLADARAAQLIRVNDGIWLRPYDVPRLLGERRYEAEADLVIEIEDRIGDGLGPAAGRYELQAGSDGAACRRTTRDADLTVTASAIGAASLGGTRLVDATRAGGVVEHRPGALAEADRLFRAAAPPYSSTFF